MRIFKLLLVPALILTATAQNRDRASVPERYRWDLTPIYENDAQWRAAKEKLAAEIPSLAAYRGKLMSSATTLAEAFEKMFALQKELSRVGVYASLLADQDTRDAAHQAMQQEVATLSSRFSSQISYISPEILEGDRATLERYMNSEPRLAPYRFRLEEILRRASHTLSEKEEKILSISGLMSGTASDAFGILSNADFPYPTVTLSDGRTARLDPATFSDLRAVANRADRETVMSAFFEALGTMSRTFGTLINGEVQRAAFYAKARNYPSDLEMYLDRPNIPVSVYYRLVEGTNKYLPLFHRYLKLRQKMLGVDQLHYYDLYAPLVPSVAATYTPEEAQQHVLAALAPLGADYTATVQRAFNERWIDLMPSTGKRSGAYMNGGVYDVHPYLLMNFNGRYADVTTMAHEMGHAMHSFNSNRNQAYVNAGYPIFVAEVASTFNESLLNDYMLRNTNSPEARISILGNYLEGIKGTLFRQVQFAEFELRLHEMAAKGEPIVGDAVAKLYLDITKKYYGHDQGICIVDDYVAHEWSFVPHFYSDFYVYQYATSFTASEALAAKVKSGDAAATKRYLEFLAAGGSKYPIDLLKDAGIDMTTDEPLDLTMQSMTRALDEMDRLLASR